MTPPRRSRTRWLLRLAAAAFAAAFVGIIAIADRGEGARWWGFLEHVPCGDKLGHVGLVGLLAFLANLAIPPRAAPAPLRPLTLVTLVLLVLLTLEELSQALLKHRTCDPLDWLADLAGLALGQLAAHLALQNRRRIPPPAMSDRTGQKNGGSHGESH